MNIMWLLDTDHMNLLEWGGKDSLPLRERLADCDPAGVATTIISFEEQMRGWIAYIARSRTVDKQVEGYRRLRGIWRTTARFPSSISTSRRRASSNSFDAPAFD
jgi:hypothetical protein